MQWAIGVVLVVSLITSACSGSGNPAAPAPAPTPQPATVTFSGHVNATNGGQPLPQQAVSFASQQLLTDAAGGFSFRLLPQTSLLTLSGTGIVTRSVTYSAQTNRDVAVD